jgi:hypothetical protein
MYLFCYITRPYFSHYFIRHIMLDFTEVRGDSSHKDAFYVYFLFSSLIQVCERFISEAHHLCKKAEFSKVIGRSCLAKSHMLPKLLAFMNKHCYRNVEIGRVP